MDRIRKEIERREKVWERGEREIERERLGVIGEYKVKKRMPENKRNENEKKLTFINFSRQTIKPDRH